MNILIILFTLILLVSCGARIIEERFDRADLEMHFGPGPIDATPPEENSVSKVIPEEKKDSPTGWWNA